jgi:hypothetical protein
MRLEQIKEIANAVLYEGYLLYPYRHTAIKNRQRWTIGVVYPKQYSQAQGSTEPWTMRTECFIETQGNAKATVDVYARFLHLLLRTETHCQDENNADQELAAERGAWGLAGYLANEPWEEGMEREVVARSLSLDALVAQPCIVPIDCPGGRIVELSKTDEASEIVREYHPLTGNVIITAALEKDGLYRLSVRIENRTIVPGEMLNHHNAVLRHSFISTHTILQVQGGAFLSQMDQPVGQHPASQDYRNLHTWPVLIGDEGDHDTMLSSPIILYDYPQIAPESPGALFDGTEIDEILTLRIMTLTDEEKEEMRRGDERTRAILERTESLTPEAFMKLHGTIRSMRPVDEGSGV